jgi:hypothetical protein
LLPVVPLLVAALVLELSAQSAGMGSCGSPAVGITCVTMMAVGPLWFLGVILLLTLATPLLARWWRGPWRVVMPLVVVLVTLVSDVVWISTGSSLPINEISVWLLIWFAGFAYADGSFDAVPARVWWWVAGVGGLMMVVLAVLGPYQPVVAASPRSMMTVLESVVGLSLLLALRRRIHASRDRPIVDLCVRHVGERTMGIYVWHGLAFAVVFGSAALIGVDLASGLGVPYLMQRALLVPLTLVLLVLVLRATAWTGRVPYPALREHVDLRERR